MGERVEVQVEGGSGPQGGNGVGSVLMMLPGLGFIAFGVLVLIVPELIRWMVAGAFIFIGLGLLFAARKVGRWKRTFSIR